jgi:hypothetical protein
VHLPSTAHSPEQNDRLDSEHEDVKSEDKEAENDIEETFSQKRNAAWTVVSDFAITQLRLARRYKAGSGHMLPKIPGADNTSPTILGLEIGMLGEEFRDLGRYGLSHPVRAPCRGALIGKGSWLDQH